MTEPILMITIINSSLNQLILKTLKRCVAFYGSDYRSSDNIIQIRIILYREIQSMKTS